MKTQIARWLVAAAAVTLIGACGGDDDSAATTSTSEATTEVTPASAYTVVHEASLKPGDTVPAPTGPVVLTISGKIANTNVDDTLQLDMDQLESLRLVSYETPDLQATGGDATFTGVLFSDLLELAGAAEFSTLKTTALNDYAVDIPAADLSYAVMLATQTNGSHMSVEAYGPVRIVYPYGSNDLDPAVYDPRWNWQLASIEVV